MKSVSTKSLTKIVSVIGAAIVAFASGCAAESASDVPSSEAEEAASTSTAALRAGGGGGRLGFTCEARTCTCSKEIEGDCDRMLINCTGDMTDFNKCMKGWLTTDCSCTARSLVRRPLGVSAPATGGVLAAP